MFVAGVARKLGTNRWIKRVQVNLRRHYRRRIDETEARLMRSATDRVVRPFEWGLDWAERWPSARETLRNGSDHEYLKQVSRAAVHSSDVFYGYEKPRDFLLSGNRLSFTSPLWTPYPENNTVHAQWFRAANRNRKAVILLPHWNAKPHEHLKLCRGLQIMGISTLRLSLPYHDWRMPQGLNRADYTVSSNLGRTIDATRQAVIDIRACIDWLETQGYEKFGIVGTSLGSCYAFLASAHDRRLRVNVFNLFSLYFADVVWTGMTTEHIRTSLEGQIDLENLREVWAAITPEHYIEKYSRFEKKSLFISSSLDTTFLPRYSKAMLKEARDRNFDHRSVVLPCGHYTLGKNPFQILDGYHICNFLLQSL